VDTFIDTGVCRTGYPAVTVRQWRALLLALLSTAVLAHKQVPHSSGKWKKPLTDLALLATGRFSSSSRDWHKPPLKGTPLARLERLGMVLLSLTQFKCYLSLLRETPNSRISEYNHKCETRNAEQEIGTNQSSQTLWAPLVDRYRSGFPHQESVGHVFWPVWNETDLCLPSKPEPLAVYPDPILKLIIPVESTSCSLWTW